MAVVTVRERRQRSAKKVGQSTKKREQSTCDVHPRRYVPKESRRRCEVVGRHHEGLKEGECEMKRKWKRRIEVKGSNRGQGPPQCRLENRPKGSRGGGGGGERRQSQTKEKHM